MYMHIIKSLQRAPTSQQWLLHVTVQSNPRLAKHFIQMYTIFNIGQFFMTERLQHKSSNVDIKMLPFSIMFSHSNEIICSASPIGGTN